MTVLYNYIVTNDVTMILYANPGSLQCKKEDDDDEETRWGGSGRPPKMKIQLLLPVSLSQSGGEV